MKRTWMLTLKEYDYMPLRAGLGLITEEELNEYAEDMRHPKLCPKIFTTRLNPMKGKYVVVEGSRIKSKPVEPRIEFQVNISYLLDLRNANSKSNGFNWETIGCLGRPAYTFAELDLGINGATWQQFVDTLLKLNKKATIDTPFYINELEPI